MRNLSASDLAHGWSDTKKGLGTWQFWLLELLGGSLMFTIGGTVVGVLFVLGMAVALWIGATASAPIRQRAELIAAVKKRLRKYATEAYGLRLQIETERAEAWKTAEQLEGKERSGVLDAYELPDVLGWYDRVYVYLQIKISQAHADDFFTGSERLGQNPDASDFSLSLHWVEFLKNKRPELMQLSDKITAADLSDVAR